MHHGKHILAIIPARGGSKSVPRKNIRLLNDKPLLTYTLLQAQQVAELDLFVVSTEDPDIREVSINNGVMVVDRPLALSTDTTATEPVLIHALETLEAEGKGPFDYIVVLEPTSPFRKPSTVSRCIQRLVDSGRDSLVTVKETRSNIGIVQDGIFHPLNPDAPRRRQERKPLYIESSTVYACRASFLLKSASLVSATWLAEVVAADESMDINTMEDFKVADFAMRSGTRPEGS